MPEAQLLGDKTYKMCYEIFCIVFIGLIYAFFKYFIIHLVISVSFALCTFLFYYQELEDIKKSENKNFREITADESNLYFWRGLIVPVSVDLV